MYQSYTQSMSLREFQGSVTNVDALRLILALQRYGAKVALFGDSCSSDAFEFGVSLCLVARRWANDTRNSLAVIPTLTLSQETYKLSKRISNVSDIFRFAEELNVSSEFEKEEIEYYISQHETNIVAVLSHLLAELHLQDAIDSMDTPNACSSETCDTCPSKCNAN